MAEESEKRFKRAMDRIFTGSSPSPPHPSPASLPDTPLPPKSKERASIGSLHKSSRMSLLKKIKQGPEIMDDKEVHQGACRPWDRGDLLRRLATFKSITWFGKPKVAGPVNCARKGWINVDVDLLACEVCGARVSFPIPSSWSQHDVEKVAEGFGKKLDSGHKDLCPWKGNVCAETLAHFPPMPPQALLETFKDRCDALSVLSSLPVISSGAMATMKLAKGPQIESLLAQPPQAIPHSGSIPSEIDAEGSSSSLVTSYYLSQRLISLCGWEPRLLPYVVDCEDNSKNSKVTSHSQSSSPSVVLVARQETQPQSTSTNWDPSSAVLDCNLCGASVGLWSFVAVTSRQHLRWSSLSKRSVVEKGNEVGTCASCVGELDDGEDEDEEEKKKVSEDISSVCKASAQSGILDLSLTIAGGPRPAYLDLRGLIPLPFPAVPAEASSSRPGGYARPQHSEVGDSVAPSEPTSEKTGNNDGNARKRKRNEKILAEQSVRGGWGFPNHSSVEAVDTRYLSRAENSAESVEMPRDMEDGNETNVGKDYGTSVCMDNGRRSSSDVKEAGSKDVLETADSTGRRLLFNEGEKPDSETGIIGDGEMQLSKRRNVSGKSVSGIENDSGECNRIKDRQDENVCNETQVAGLSSSTSADGTGKELTAKNLWEKEGKEFDPLLQHRHFCPWVNASTFVTEVGSEKQGSCGWQLTLDALSIPVVESESASASSLYKKADPLASVEKIFGSSSQSKRSRRVSG